MLQRTQRDAMRERARRLLFALMEECARSATRSVGFYRCILNPRSFDETVNNLFTVSHLLLERKIKVCHDKDNKPVIFIIDSDAVAQQQCISHSQLVLDFNYSIYEVRLEVERTAAHRFRDRVLLTRCATSQDLCREFAHEISQPFGTEASSAADARPP